MRAISRLNREKRTVGLMIKMYCDHNHNKDGTLCNECYVLTEFAHERMNRCVFQNDKPVCSECQIHCFHQEMRDKIKTVMRFSGPRMIYKHPIIGIRHLIDKRRFKYVNLKTYRSEKKY